MFGGDERGLYGKLILYAHASHSKLISYFTDDGRREHGFVVAPAMLAIYNIITFIRQQMLVID